MKRHAFLALLGGATAAWPVAGRGQQAGRIMICLFELELAKRTCTVWPS